MKTTKCILGAMLLTTFFSCNNQLKNASILKQSDFSQPPVAEIKADTFTRFGVQRIDHYFWMKDKTNPKVIEYLKAENAYTDSVMASTKDFQQKIYDEIIGRIKEDDQTYPTLSNGYYYYTRT